MMILFVKEKEFIIYFEFKFLVIKLIIDERLWEF